MESVRLKADDVMDGTKWKRELGLCLGWKQCLSQDLDFFPKKELFKFFRELFAKERSYPSTTKLHDEARKQVRSSYITCTEYTKQNIVPS